MRPSEWVGGLLRATGLALMLNVPPIAIPILLLNAGSTGALAAYEGFSSS